MLMCKGMDFIQDFMAQIKLQKRVKKAPKQHFPPNPFKNKKG